MDFQHGYDLRRRSGIHYYTATDNTDRRHIAKCKGTFKVPGRLSIDNPACWVTLFSETTMWTGHDWEELAEDDALVAEVVVRSVRGRVSQLGLAKAKAR